MEKKISRMRRALRTRSKIKNLGVIRLSVHRTPCHIYAQLIAPSSDRILVSASTLDKEVKEKIKTGGNIEAAKMVGSLIAKRAREAGIEKIAFDRSGFRYHGRVKALAEAARESGIKF
jgi:large subunit ribosomal protein L18